MLNIKDNLLNFNLKNEIENKKSQINLFIEDCLKRKEDKNDWLGWLNLHEDEQSFQEIKEYSKEIVESKKFDNLVILGIGGSALGPKAIIQALKHPLWNELSSEKRQGFLKIYFIDNVDPDWTNSILNHLDIKRTLFCTITKSGGTAETTSVFLWARDMLIKELGDNWKKNLVLITDPKKGTLRAFADRENVKSFKIESSVGGRFSVFSAVGMLPAALCGIDIDKFKKALAISYKDIFEKKNLDNLGLKLAIALFHADKNLGKKTNILMPYSSHLEKIADWYVQLVAESLGKNRQTGPLPVKAVGATDQHSQLQLFAEGPLDKIVFFIKINNFKNDFNIPKQEVIGFENLAGETLKRLIHAEGEGTARALAKKEVPSLTIEMPEISEENLAELLYGFEIMTALSGFLYNVDPFNQPGVELSKKYTYALLGKKGFEEYLKELV